MQLVYSIYHFPKVYSIQSFCISRKENNIKGNCRRI